MGEVEYGVGKMRRRCEKYTGVVRGHSVGGGGTIRKGKGEWGERSHSGKENRGSREGRWG